MQETPEAPAKLSVITLTKTKMLI